VKTVALFGLLCLAPLASGQNGASPQAAPAQTQVQPSRLAVKVDPAKEASIRKLFEIAGSRAAVEKVIAGMIDNMRPLSSPRLLE